MKKEELKFKETEKIIEPEKPLGITNGDLKMSEIKKGDTFYEVDHREECYVYLKAATTPHYSDTYRDWEMIVEKINEPEVQREIIVPEEYTVLSAALYSTLPYSNFEEL